MANKVCELHTSPLSLNYNYLCINFVLLGLYVEFLVYFETREDNGLFLGVDYKKIVSVLVQNDAVVFMKIFLPSR